MKRMPIFPMVLSGVVVFLLCFAGGMELFPNPVDRARAVGGGQWPAGGVFERSLNDGYNEWRSEVVKNHRGINGEPQSDEIKTLEKKNDESKKVLELLQHDVEDFKKRDTDLQDMTSNHEMRKYLRKIFDQDTAFKDISASLGRSELAALELARNNRNRTRQLLEELIRETQDEDFGKKTFEERLDRGIGIRKAEGDFDVASKKYDEELVNARTKPTRLGGGGR